MFVLVDYEKKYELDVIILWQSVCIDEFEFDDWKEGMSVVDAHLYEKFILAIIDQRVIGSIAYKNLGENIAELKRVYVYPEYRGKGISQAMLNEILKDLKEKGFKKIIIETWAKFSRGISFYEKNDFKLKEIDGKCLIYERDL